jgi:hypothetical protein
MSIHSADRKIETLDDLKKLREAHEPLFGLGMIYATPAAMLHLVQFVNPYGSLLVRHSHGDYGDLCADDRRLNDQAIINGGRILSAYTVDGEKLYVITEAQNDDGIRATTTILFASEY